LWYRKSHLKETLQITEVGDAAVYLLNPQVITKEGEWEAWFFANWLPGARRYRSFEELMRADYAQCAGLEWGPPTGVVGVLPDEYIGSPGSPKRRLLKRKRRREPRVLNKQLSKWTVDELLEILRNPEFNIIHSEAIYGLGILGDQRAVEPLFALLRGNELNATWAAHALKRLAPERLRNELLELLSNWHSRLFAVLIFAGVLAELRDERVLPVLMQIMRDESQEPLYVTECVGSFVAQLGRAGFEALAEALQSDSPTVRRRATAALVHTNQGEARDALDPLTHDPDTGVRELVQMALQVLPPKRL
jgi:hypothetical protein